MPKCFITIVYAWVDNESITVKSKVFTSEPDEDTITQFLVATRAALPGDKYTLTAKVEKHYTLSD